MLDRLDQIEAQYEELTAQLATPELLGDPVRYPKAAKAHADLAETVERYREFRRLRQAIADTQQTLSGADAEWRALAEEEIATLEKRRAAVEEELRLRLVPKDPHDEKNVVLEVRAGTGGDEASLFAAEMFRMYTRYAEARRWRVEILSTSESGVHGLKEVVAIIEGKGAYSRLKFESGVHRVQRVPQTEQQGRIHTSTVTVAVLPEAEEVEIKIDPKDIRIDTFCSSGPGGQSVNTTYSAVRITHLPTGLIVSCQDEKSQIKNRAKAERVLRSRLLEIEQRKQHEQIAAERRSQVGTGERSDKIRTYNFKENRVSDHRIGLTLYRLAEVMDGRLDEFVDALAANDQAEKLKAAEPVKA
ncbi:MAG: peptide chain release factor 1 [Terriglobales bacterium]